MKFILLVIKNCFFILDCFLHHVSDILVSYKNKKCVLYLQIGEMCVSINDNNNFEYLNWINISTYKSWLPCLLSAMWSVEWKHDLLSLHRIYYGALLPLTSIRTVLFLSICVVCDCPRWSVCTSVSCFTFKEHGLKREEVVCDELISRLNWLNVNKKPLLFKNILTKSFYVNRYQGNSQIIDVNDTDK